MNASRILQNFINFVFGMIETIIALRILLKFLNANPNTPFVRWKNSLKRIN
jgi:undecaprenyl pyrophosphate phosphatase UppP